MANTNSISNIPVVPYKPSRWESIKNALNEEVKKDSEKSIGDRLKENIESPLYAIKGAASSLVDTASFAWDVVSSPIETGEKIGTGVVNAYHAVVDTSADQKLDWLTHKSIQAIHSTPQEKSEAIGHLAGDILIGEGIAKGIKSVAKLGRAGEVIAEATENIPKTKSAATVAETVVAETPKAQAATATAETVIKEIPKTQAASTVAESVVAETPKAPFNKVADGIAELKNERKVANGVLDQAPKEIENNYNKLLQGGEKAPAPKPEMTVSDNGYRPEWPNKEYAEKLLGGQKAENLAQKINFPENQLQSKFEKHAADFGIKENYSPKNLKKFEQAMREHMENPNTKEIMGTYHKEPAIHYFNAATKNNIILHSDGTFWSCWKLSDAKISHLIKHGGI